MPVDNPLELFYQVDEHDKVIGSVTRGEAHSTPQIIHRSTALLVINDQNEMLFQKRNLLKDLYPGEWSYAVGGHVQYGETYEATIKRELQEELGIKSTDTKFLKKILTSTGLETEMKAIFELKVNSRPFITFDPTEISEVKWLRIDDISQFIQENLVASWAVEVLRETGYLK